MTSFISGATMLLGVLLAVAGVLKLARPRAVGHAVYRLLPQRHEWERDLAKVSGGLIGSVEILVGIPLAAATWLPDGIAAAAQVAATVLYIGFVGVIAIAIRRGAACGCWSSFSDGPAGGAELGRAVTLAVIASVATALTLAAHPGRAWSWRSAAWAMGLAACVVLAAALGGWIDRRRSEAIDAKRGISHFRPWSPLVSLAGRVTSSKESFALPRQVLLGPGERDRVVAAVLASATGRSFAEWIAARNGALDWSSASAVRTKVRLDGRDGERIVVTPSSGQSASVTASVKVDAGELGEPMFFGSIDGQSVLAAEGRVLELGPATGAVPAEIGESATAP